MYLYNFAEYPCISVLDIVGKTDSITPALDQPICLLYELGLVGFSKWGVTFKHYWFY